MSANARNLVVVVTRGIDHELSSVAFTIANGGLTAGLAVSIFLSSAGVDLARKRTIDMAHVKPLEPLADLVKDFIARGGTIWACTPCVKSRGYTEDDHPPGRGHQWRERDARAHQGRCRHAELLAVRETMRRVSKNCWMGEPR